MPKIFIGFICFLSTLNLFSQNIDSFWNIWMDENQEDTSNEVQHSVSHSLESTIE